LALPGLPSINSGLATLRTLLDEYLPKKPLSGMPPGKVGGSVFVKPGDMNIAVVECRSSTKAASSEAEVLTVCVQPIYTFPPTGSLVPIYPVLGRLDWGAGNASFTCNFDILNGVTFSLPANYCKVTVNYPITTLAVPPPIQVNAMLSYGTVDLNSNGLRLTQTLQNFNALVVTPYVFTVAPPPFANSFIVQASSLVYTAPILIQAFNNPGSELASWTQTSNENNRNQMENTYPIPNGTSYIQVSGTPTSTGYQSIGILWGLSL
jgi:hypothetical protein